MSTLALALNGIGILELLLIAGLSLFMLGVIALVVFVAVKVAMKSS